MAVELPVGPIVVVVEQEGDLAVGRVDRVGLFGLRIRRRVRAAVWRCGGKDPTASGRGRRRRSRRRRPADDGEPQEVDV